jgi:hypothetical protein
MLPWLPEDFYEDSTIVTIQWSIGKKYFSLFLLLGYLDWIRSVEFVPFISHPIQNNI